MRRDVGGETQFATALIFDATASVREFAGADSERAYAPEKARAVLARYDERSVHFDVLLTPDETGWPAFLARPRS